MYISENDVRVTVITPSYNRASYLDETIQSVLSQDYLNIEYIVLDDGSHDNTIEVINKYSDRLKWDKHPNMGEQRTVNKGFEMASGELIAVINSDDPIRQGLIRDAVRSLEDFPEAVAAYPNWDEIDASGNKLRTMELPEYDIRVMLTSLDISIGPGLVFRKRVLSKIGGRDITLRYAGDLDFYLKLALYGQLKHIPKVLATHRVHDDSAFVSGRSGKLSNELAIALSRPLYSELLPKDLQQQKKIILSRIHWLASTRHFCGNDSIAKIKHLLLSYYYRFL